LAHRLILLSLGSVITAFSIDLSTTPGQPWPIDTPACVVSLSQPFVLLSLFGCLFTRCSQTAVWHRQDTHGVDQPSRDPHKPPHIEVQRGFELSERICSSGRAPLLESRLEFLPFIRQEFHPGGVRHTGNPEELSGSRRFGPSTRRCVRGDGWSRAPQRAFTRSARGPTKATIPFNDPLNSICQSEVHTQDHVKRAQCLLARTKRIERSPPTPCSTWNHPMPAFTRVGSKL
jgi:hypothetical protein